MGILKQKGGHDYLITNYVGSAVSSNDNVSYGSEILFPLARGGSILPNATSIPADSMNKE